MTGAEARISMPIGMGAAGLMHRRSEEFTVNSIQDLTKGILKGDTSAFDVFYSCYSPRVYRLLLVVTNGDEGLSRELHQCVMIKAAQKLKVFGSEQELWAWLSQVARNAWVDFLRRRSRERKVL